MGRPPDPTHLKLVKGNPGKRKIDKNEPKPEGDLKNPPRWFNDQQKLIWKYAIANAPKGLLKRLDQSVLTLWCVASDIHRQAAEQLAEPNEALVIENMQGNLVPNPLVKIMGDQATVMNKCSQEMGFTPASRTRVSLEDKEGGKKTGWDDL